MQLCSNDGCGLRIWSTDKGVCPRCFPEENRAVYGIKINTPEVVAEVKSVPHQEIVDLLPEYTGTDKKLASIMKFHILKVYEEEGKHKTRAAKKLGITTKTLYNHLERYKVS